VIEDSVFFGAEDIQANQAIFIENERLREAWKTQSIDNHGDAAVQHDSRSREYENRKSIARPASAAHSSGFSSP